MALNESINECELNQCKHCGQTLNKNQVDFCCPGCRMVYSVLQDKGLDQYYTLKGELINEPVQLSHDEYDYLSTESFFEKWVKPAGDHCRLVLYVKGIQCAACVWLIERILEKNSCVVSHQLFMGTGKLELIFKRELNLQQLAVELAQVGYRVGLQESGEEEERRQKQRDIFRLGITGALTGNLMMLTLPLYTGGHQSEHASMFASITFGISLIVLLYSARPFYQKAISSARQLMFHLDIPITIGILGGELLSVYNLLNRNYAGLYFDTIGMLVFFLLAGRFVQARSVHRAMEQCRRLMAEVPELTEAFREGRWVNLVSEDIVADDLLRLHSGDVLPVDGELVSDVSTWNMQVISGESKPLRLRQGESIPAGSINMGGLVEVKAATTIFDGSLVKMEQAADKETEHQLEIQNSHLAGWFTLVTLSVAGLGVALWWQHGLVEAFKVGLTVFVVACPCALALARPTADAFGVIRASEKNIWIKKDHFFRRMETIRHIVFDKTGVLTYGEPEIVTRIDLYSDQAWLERAIYQLESHSDHMVAALLTRLFNREVTEPENTLQDVEILPGQGIRGRVDGREVWVGSLDAYSEVIGPEAAELVQKKGISLEQNIVTVGVDGKLALVLGLTDKVIEGVPELLDSLLSKGYRVSIFSGDRQEVVDKIAARHPGLTGMGNMKPQEKLSAIREQSQAEPVLMVGDGLNDMGALAAADIGIAAGQAAPSALRYADVVFHGTRVTSIFQLIGLAKTVKKAIISNISVSLCYNAASFYLAITGVIGPLVAAILMPLSSLSVIGISAWKIRRNRKTWEF